MANKTPAAKPAEEAFDSVMARLEHIVEQMEAENLPLEDLLARYEEGVKLVKVAEEKLAAAEKRIEIITRNAAGEPEIEEFEPEKKPAAAPQKAAPAPREDVSLF